MAPLCPGPDAALQDHGGRAASSGRAIAAVQALRGWRDVGAAPGLPIPARLDAEGLRGHGRLRSRAWRAEWSSTAASPSPGSPCRAASVAIFASAAR